MGRKFLKRGFTLIETVVTVGIIAGMAAVVIPQVVKQADNAEPTRAQEDLKSFQTAIETFHTNLKTVYPTDFDDLTNPLTAGALAGAVDTALSSTGAIVAYGSETSNWAGPYVDFAASPGDTRTTGFGGTILGKFVCYNASLNAEASNGSEANPACPSPGPSDRLFLAIRVTGLGNSTDSRFISLNDRFDGSNAAEVAARATLGRIRLITNVNAAGPTGAVVYFLATPIN